MFPLAPLRLWGIVWIFLGAAPIEAAGPVAKWLGQDGKDFVGGEPGPAPNGYQDVHVVLSGLPAGRTLAEVEFKGHGRGAWNNQVTNKAAVHVVRGSKPGSFDLYLEPFERETGREFEIKWKLDNGPGGGLYFAGGKADPNLRVGDRGEVGQPGRGRGDLPRPDRPGCGSWAGRVGRCPDRDRQAGPQSGDQGGRRRPGDWADLALGFEPARSAER